MILKGIYEIPTSDFTRKVGVTIDIESKDFSFNALTRELDFVITQHLIVETRHSKSRVEYELVKLASSIVNILAKENPDYCYAAGALLLQLDELKAYFEQPTVVDSTARDITNIRQINEANS